MTSATGPPRAEAEGCGGLSIGLVNISRLAAGAGVTEPPRYSPMVIRVNSHCIALSL